jgi:hypothetical protein
VLLVNGLVAGSVWDERWRYWFLEVLVAVLGVLGLVFALPALRRLEQGRPLLVAAAFLALALVPRLAGGAAVPHHYYRPATIAWIVVLGWLIERAKGRMAKLAVTGTVVVTVWGYFGDPSRELVVIAGLLALLWVPWVAVPRALNRVLGLLAGTSMYIYLTHPQVYPAVRDATSPQLAFVASLAVGVAVGIAAQRLLGRAEARLGRSAVHRRRAVPSAQSVEVVRV